MYKFRPEVDTTELVLAYQEVFAGPPWNEKTKCLECESFYGLDTKKGDICPKECSGSLVEAYPYQETKNYLTLDCQRLDSLTVILRDPKIAYRNLPDYLGRFVGFGLGFVFDTSEFILEKYKTGLMQENIETVLNLNGIEDQFFYISEVGVREPYRGKGLSNKLVEKLVSKAIQLKQPVVMRTNMGSPMVAVAQRFGMQQVLGPKVEVCRGCQRFNISNQAINGLDFENRNRVLFVKN